MRKERPLPTSAPHREQLIGFLDKLYTRLMLGSKSTQTIGEGESRARKRLAAKRRANMDIPSNPVVTRQQVRRETILRKRQVLTVAKAEVTKLKLNGGSAIIRKVEDIEAFLGA